MNFYGLSGPFINDGGNMSVPESILKFHYKAEATGHAINVDIFVGVVGGIYLHTTVRNGLQSFVCRYPNSGFRYINFLGSKVLAPYNQHAYLDSLYGPDYMKPAPSESQRGCFYTRHIEFNSHPMVEHVEIPVMRNGWRGFIVDPYVDDAMPSYVKDDQITQIFRALARIASKNRLKYVLACDSARYALGLFSVPPWYGAIAVLPREADVWLEQIKYFAVNTTLRCEHESDGSIAHIRFSQFSSTRVVVHALDDDKWPETKPIKYGEFSVPLNVPANANASLDSVKDLCAYCVHCQAPRLFALSGALVNGLYKHLCLETTSHGAIVTGPCRRNVCFLVNYG